MPKTNDNDLGGTVVTFGFATAGSFATEALDRLRLIAMSHHRVMVVEMMAALPAESRRGNSAAWSRPPDTTDVPIAEAVGTLRTVPVDGDLVTTGRALGICSGE